jgi:hypothetical protein
MTAILEPGLEHRAAPGRRRAFVVFLVALRVLATLHAAVAVTQPVSIGQYLSGGYGWLGVHGGGAGGLLLTGLLLAAASIGYTVTGGRIWVALVGPLLWLAEGVQDGLGYARVLAVHIPLGVLIVAAALLLAVWVWTPAAGRPRARR